MNVRELMAKLSRLDPNLPVVIEQEDLDLVGGYVEVMNVKFSGDEVYFDKEAFSLDGSRPYDRKDWHCVPCDCETEPVVLLSCKLPYQPIIDGALEQAALGLGQSE